MTFVGDSFKVEAESETVSVPSYMSLGHDSTETDTCSSSDEERVLIGVSEYDCNKEEPEENENKAFIPKTKGETLYQDLPLVEPCKAEYPENGHLLPIARVSHFTEKFVILSSLIDAPTVDEGTILWTEAKTSIAQVFETFGPVRKPFYSFRINSVEDIPSLGVALGDTVFIIPAHPSFTKYVFPQELMKWKGSDASWKDDNEVPLQFQEYSDDENEEKASKKGNERRKKRTKHPRSMSLNHFSAEHIDEPNMQGYLPGDIYVQQPIRPPGYPNHLFPNYFPGAAFQSYSLMDTSIFPTEAQVPPPIPPAMYGPTQSLPVRTDFHPHFLHY